MMTIVVSFEMSLVTFSPKKKKLGSNARKCNIFTAKKLILFIRSFVWQKKKKKGDI